MTKTELERAVADAAGVEKRTAAAVLDALQDVVTTNVRKGQAVTIRPGFIKVSRKDVKHAKREGTNPFTGEPTVFKAPSGLEDGEGHGPQEAEGWRRDEVALTGPDALGDSSRVAEPREPDLDQNPTSIGRVWSPGPGGAIWA